MVFPTFFNLSLNLAILATFRMHVVTFSGLLDLKVNGQPLAGREACGYDEGGFEEYSSLHISTPWTHRKLGMEQGAPSPGI